MYNIYLYEDIKICLFLFVGTRNIIFGALKFGKKITQKSQIKSLKVAVSSKMMFALQPNKMGQI